MHSPRLETTGPGLSTICQLRFVKPCAESPDSHAVEGFVSKELLAGLAHLRKGENSCEAVSITSAAVFVKLSFCRLMAFSDGSFVVTRLKDISELESWFQEIFSLSNPDSS